MFVFHLFDCTDAVYVFWCWLLVPLFLLATFSHHHSHDGHFLHKKMHKSSFMYYLPIIMITKQIKTIPSAHCCTSETHWWTLSSWSDSSVFNASKVSCCTWRTFWVYKIKKSTLKSPAFTGAVSDFWETVDFWNLHPKQTNKPLPKRNTPLTSLHKHRQTAGASDSSYGWISFDLRTTTTTAYSSISWFKNKNRNKASYYRHSRSLTLLQNWKVFPVLMRVQKVLPDRNPIYTAKTMHKHNIVFNRHIHIHTPDI